MREIPIDLQNQADALITTGTAARLLAMSTSGVRHLAEKGHLPFVQKLPGTLGAYVFRAADVEALAAERRAALAAKLDSMSGGAA